MIRFLILLFLVGGFYQCKPDQDTSYLQFRDKPGVPASIKKEHEILLGQIRDLARYSDSTGIIAQKLLVLMEHHFAEEENYVLPQLGLLEALASGELPGESEEIIRLSEESRSQRQHLGAEHQMIKAHLKELVIAAESDRHDVRNFLDGIERHAAMEEEVIFPLSILIGDYLAIKSSARTGKE